MYANELRNKEWLKCENKVSKFYIVARSTKLMAIRKQLHDVLTLIAELGHNNVNEDIRHTLVKIITPSDMLAPNTRGYFEPSK